MGDLYLNIFPNWCFTSNLSHHRNGRIVLAWDPDVFQMNIIHMDSQMIHGFVTPRYSGVGFFVSFIYGLNLATEREPLWATLCTLASMIHSAWVIMGDFNAVKEIEDRIGPPVRLSDIQPMRNCMAMCQLTEVKTIGRLYTWNNKQDGGNRVFSRIDRVLSNSAWDDMFPNAEALYLPEGTYDHCPMVLSSYPTIHQKKPFRFYNMWTSSDEFLPIVERNWSRYVYGCVMFRITQKLKWIKNDLKLLNHTGYSNVEATKVQLQAHLAEIQDKLQSDPTNIELSTAEKIAATAYWKTQDNLLSFLHQTSKVHWLEKGDENSKAFYQSIKQRRKYNNIHSIQNAGGVWVNSPKEVQDAFLDFYRNLFCYKKDKRLPI
ncbi:uncharacterized protein [Spinacia oleracea]|uniref:Endonuclease/exonuclease/phosphatase domain-containing protein n=1 Tax=Spinacia oleracea TaxID=3562 RepID=A0A9R0IXE6_SPIOL|nr:uncharacterized protein LOC110795330 [Spinacia oleracea]